MKAVLFIRWGDFGSYLFRDLIDCANIKTFYINKPIENKILRVFHKIHTSHKINSCVPLPSQEIWNDINKAIELCSISDYCIFINSGTLECINLKYLKILKNKCPKCKMVLIITDSMKAHSNNLIYTKPLVFGFGWDLILSYDREDCKDYGFTYLGYSYYSMIGTPGAKKSKTEYDLYSICNRKHADLSREKIMNSLYEECVSHSLKCNFSVVIGNDKKVTDNGIHYLSKGLLYEQIVKEIQESNCILEILQSGQHQQTIRYFEAVCYNKKLLTNNPNIVSLPYYNPKYMKVFTTEKDLDFEWIKKVENIDYQYRGDFSPNKLLGLIEKMKGI